MASQMIDSILSAEKECDRRLHEAGEKAADIRADAEKRQAELLTEARVEAKNARQQIIAQAQTEADRIQSETDVKTAEDVRALKDSVRRRSGAAVNAVTELLLQIS